MRFSIGKLMLLVAICAVNVFLFSKLGSPPSTYGVEQRFGELIVIGGLPMLDVIGFLALTRTTGRRALDDFLIGGVSALLLYLGVAAMAFTFIRDITLSSLNVIVPLGNRTLPRIIARVTVGVLLNLVPQFAAAYPLGRLIRALRDREPTPAVPDSPPPE